MEKIILLEIQLGSRFWSKRHQCWVEIISLDEPHYLCRVEKEPFFEAVLPSTDFSRKP